MRHYLSTNIDSQVSWSPDFHQQLPMFEPLQQLLKSFAAFKEWPGIDDFQQVLEAWPEPIMTLGGMPLKIVKQDGRPHTFAESYAPRIYQTGEIQTRLGNWHDFFQYLTWFIFPRSKAVINSIHIPRAKERIDGGGDPGRRSPIENMLSLFDEGGAVVLSSDESMLQLIRDFRWKELFWERRAELESKLKCITFGHAMYEKGLMPYVGMTANSILLHVGEDFFEKKLSAQLQQVDESLAEIFTKGEAYVKPKDLQPFPILGMPGWTPDNEDESYYDNSRYFRAGRGNHK
ncbi:MAG: DUF3025 domain-containing protein [Gammaproteobacteria bacterium]|nr:DUF3025 domain-containing protein [Gammaproteobacteria bacterium]